MFKLVIFDFDGTIFDSYEAIEHCATLTFETLSKDQAPPKEELRRLISKGAALAEAFRILHPDQKDFDPQEWTRTYRGLYAVHGQALTRPYPGLREVLDALKAANVIVAIASNKVFDSIKTALKRLDLLDYFPEPLIIGDNIDGSKRKPDPVSYTDILLPRLKTLYGEDFALRPEEVLMVGDTVTDIQYARNIGVKVCWCRFGQGDHEECEAAKPEFTIDELVDVVGVVMGK
ncbi:HAD-like domain-containing protein [Aspergillus ambiguus]|uniref:HAD family hydrolase n=1 Tax=Aspergillus ambiguus TaxID=176160 RepID=UPI003CCD5B9D